MMTKREVPLAKSTQAAITAAAEVAADQGCTIAEPEHLLLALLRPPQRNAADWLRQLGSDPEAVARELERQPVPAREGFARVLAAAGELASQLGDNFVASEHVLLALCEALPAGSVARDVLARHGCTAACMREALGPRARPKAKAPRSVGALIAKLDGFVPSGDGSDELALAQITAELGRLAHAERAIGPMLGVFERNPEADLGAPGPLVHAIEGLPGYLPLLLASLERVPSEHGVRLLERYLKGPATDGERTTLRTALAKAKAGLRPKQKPEAKAKARRARR